jgi:hypothetical protein
MDDDNPHGGGVAWLQDGKLHFHRGLDARQIYAMQECGIITLPYLLHFRWATHGSKRPQLTHPFPTGPRAFYGELKGTAEEVLIHNGVWNDYDEWLPMIEGVPAPLLTDISDTAVAAYFYAWFPDIGDEIPWAVATARVAEDGSLAIIKHGGWSEHEGNEFSNLQWLPWNKWPTTGRNWTRRASGGWTWSDAPGEEGGWDYSPYATQADEATKDAQSEDSWRDYVRWRYGDEIADAVGEACPDGEDDAITMAKLAALEELEVLQGEKHDDDDALDHADMVSDDPATVNQWLSQQSARAFLKPAEPLDWSKYAKCAMCDVYTKAKDGVCGFCVAQLAKESA